MANAVRRFVASVLVVVACGGAASSVGTDTTATVVPKGLRRFGIHVSEAQTGGYDQAFNRARQLGMDVLPWSITWTQIQTDRGFDTSILDVANTYYGTQGIPVHLTILSPINTNITDVPSALRGVRLDDPRVTVAFRVFLDSLHAKLPRLQLHSLIVGNEIDATLGANDELWRQFQVFFDSARVHARRLWGNGVRVGVTVTFNGVKQNPPGLGRLVQTLDFLSVTYYPLAPNFTVRPIGDVATDMALVLGRFPDKPVQFPEVGIPSGTANGSSEDNQAAFVGEVFRVWDANAARIPFLAYLWLTDLSEEQATSFVGYYGLTGQPDAGRFKEYLRTLGLRRYPGAGADKPAVSRLGRELSARGW